jgi:two-component sensor histidine kinase
MALLCMTTAFAQPYKDVPDSVNQKLRRFDVQTHDSILLMEGYNLCTANQPEAIQAGLVCLQQGLRISEAQKDTFLTNAIRASLADVYVKLRYNLPDAIAYYEAVRQTIKPSSAAHLLLAQNQLRIAQAYALMQQPVPLRKTIDQTNNYLTGNKVPRGLKTMAQQLALQTINYYLDLNDYAAAEKLAATIIDTLKVNLARPTDFPYATYYTRYRTTGFMQRNLPDSALQVWQQFLPKAAADSLYAFTAYKDFCVQYGFHKEANLAWPVIDSLKQSHANTAINSNINVKLANQSLQLRSNQLSAEKKSARQLRTILWLAVAGIVLLGAGIGVFVFLNRKLRRQKKRIETQDAEKALLLGEIHHRVKNNLEMLQSMLLLQMREYKEDETVQQALGEANNRIQSIAVLHKQLYSGNLATTTARSYFTEMFSRVMADVNQRRPVAVNHELDIDDTELPPDILLPLALLINEWITNAMKYAFAPDQGGPELRMHLHAADGYFNVLFADNGQAVNDGETGGTGFGSRLVKSLVKQLKGQLTTSTAPGGGLQYNLRMLMKIIPA